MKHLFLYVVLFMFVANNMVLAAWVKPCMSNDTQPMEISVEASVSEEMPCHEEESSQALMQCDGVCLCLNALVSQTPVLDSGYIFHSFNHAERIRVSEHVFASLISNPLYRPPILIS